LARLRVLAAALVGKWVACCQLRKRVTSYGGRDDWLAAPQTRLNAARRKRQVSQYELSQVTGISERTLSRLENGEITNPPLRYLVNCAKALGMDWHELIEPEWEQWEPRLRGEKFPPLPERRAESDPDVHRI
jgi:transcriptional regulator with XRE-family HTH domain